jgi:hypothetical protein
VRVSRRERLLIVLGIIGAIALVLYPLAYRIGTEQARDQVIRPAASVGSTASQPRATRPVVPRISFVLPHPIDSTWTADATSHRGENGRVFEFACAPAGAPGSIRGTDTYTDDSSVCTAAVHRGLITLAGGGRVTIVIRPALETYVGSTRNGVTTESYGPWEGSYEFIEAD